jgi:Recombinase
LVKEPAEQKVIRRILSMRGSGASCRAIASQLNADGHTTKRVRPWTSSAVSDVLTHSRTIRKAA